MTCSVCLKKHFTERKITKAFSQGQGALWPSVRKVNLSPINARTGCSLRRGEFGSTIFFLDCRYFKVYEGNCPLPGPKFRMGTADFLPIVGRVDSATGDKSFFQCSVDLEVILQFGTGEKWMKSSAHMVDLCEFLDSFEVLAEGEFFPGCIESVKTLWCN